MAQSYLMKSACLASDVYKGQTIIKNAYKMLNYKYTDIKGYSSILSLKQEKTLFIAFRGCKDLDEVVSCIESKLVKPIPSKDMMINIALWNKYEGVRDVTFDLIDTYINEHKNDINEIVFTGHSLGGALAQISGTLYDKYCISQLSKKCITLGTPYIGDVNYVSATNESYDSNIRIEAAQDIIPKIKFNKHMVHSGEEKIIQSKSNAPFPISIYDHHSSINYIKCLRNEA